MLTRRDFIFLIFCYFVRFAREGEEYLGVLRYLEGKRDIFAPFSQNLRISQGNKQAWCNQARQLAVFAKAASL